MTSTSQGSCWDFQLLGPQLWEDALVSVDDKGRPGWGGGGGAARAGCRGTGRKQGLVAAG